MTSGAHASARIEKMAARLEVRPDILAKELEAYGQAVEREIVQLTNEDRLFAADFITAVLKMGICPMGYDRDDLAEFRDRLLKQRAESAAIRGEGA